MHISEKFNFTRQYERNRSFIIKNLGTSPFRIKLLTPIVTSPDSPPSHMLIPSIIIKKIGEECHLFPDLPHPYAHQLSQYLENKDLKVTQVRAVKIDLVF